MHRTWLIAPYTYRYQKKVSHMRAMTDRERGDDSLIGKTTRREKSTSLFDDNFREALVVSLRLTVHHRLGSRAGRYKKAWFGFESGY